MITQQKTAVCSKFLIHTISLMNRQELNPEQTVKQALAFTTRPLQGKNTTSGSL